MNNNEDRAVRKVIIDPGHGGTDSGAEPIPVRAAEHVCAGRSGGHHSGSGDILL